MTDNCKQAEKRYALHDLFPGLEKILDETEAIAREHVANKQELFAMADQLTEIRLTLTALRQASVPEALTLSFQNLLARFTALEGRIKELRNDLA